MTVYGLGAAVFTQNINCAIETAHTLQAGTVWVSVLSLRRETTSQCLVFLPSRSTVTTIWMCKLPSVVTNILVSAAKWEKMLFQSMCFFFPLLITRVAILFYFLSATQKSKLCMVTMSSISTMATPDATMNSAAKLKPKTVPICQHPHHVHAHEAWHDTSASDADKVHHNLLPM